MFKNNKGLNHFMEQITNFVENLANYKVGDNVTNIYDYTNKNNELRRENLRLYLQSRIQNKPQFLLVGEAPGYRGCRLTGIPFTSEYIIFKENFQLFSNNKYKKTDEYPKYRKEPTATMMWGVFKEFNFYPLLWNAFPFHPHKKDNSNSNRPPTNLELEKGMSFLSELIEIFAIDKNSIIAVGKNADDLLKRNNFVCKYARHPANGGKSDFIRDLKLIVGLE